jgi:hypothetical protein
MPNEAKIREAISLIWRNLPGSSVTFARCSRGCGRGKGGRGGGPCIDCARDDLAKLVGEDKADEYVAAVREVRQLEREMIP